LTTEIFLSLSGDKVLISFVTVVELVHQAMSNFLKRNSNKTLRRGRIKAKLWTDTAVRKIIIFLVLGACSFDTHSH